MVTVVLALGLLVPASLGLSPHAITDPAMGGSMAVGSLAFERPVQHIDELRAGDVISFARPGSDEGPNVTRRVVSVEFASVVTRGDARSQVDSWVLEPRAAELSLTVFALPVLGYPQLAVPWLTWPVVLLLAAVALAATTVVARREAARARSGATSTGGGPAVATI